MRSILIVALSIPGLGLDLLTTQPVKASAMNGACLQNAAIASLGIAMNGGDQVGLSLEGVILPETVE